MPKEKFVWPITTAGLQTSTEQSVSITLLLIAIFNIYGLSLWLLLALVWNERPVLMRLQLNQLYLIQIPQTIIENLLVFGTPTSPFSLELWISQVRNYLESWDIITCEPSQGCNSPRTQKGLPVCLGSEWIKASKVTYRKRNFFNFNISLFYILTCIILFEYVSPAFIQLMLLIWTYYCTRSAIYY